MRPVPSRRKSKNVPPVPPKKKSTVTSRRGRNYIPSRPVVKNCMHRPVPSSKKKKPVPCRRDKFNLPSRPVMKQKVICTVPSRPVEKIHTHRPVPSHPGNHNFHCFTVPSRPVSSRLQFFSRQTCQNSTVPSRLEYYQPWKALIFCAIPEATRLRTRVY